MEPSGTEPKAPSLSEQNRSVYTQHAREREAVRAATVEAKAHSATDLLALWKCRRDNPLYVYLAPWKRGTAMRILFFSGLILHLWLPLLIFYPSLRIRLALAIVMFPLGFLLPPLMFLCFATTRTGDELVELYLTRMSDSEVVLGSVIWGLLTGWASTVVLSIYIVIDLVLIGATINHIVAFFFWYFLPLTILPIKSLRLWLTTRWARWTILVTAPISMALEYAVLLLAAFISAMVSSGMMRFRSGDSAFTAFMVVSSGLCAMAIVFLHLYNARVAMKWATTLYYSEFHGSHWFDLFVGRKSKAQAIESKAQTP